MLFDVNGSTVLTSAEWNKLINDGYRALWAEVTEVHKYFRVNTDTFTITTGQTRALPADYQETVNVRRDPNTDFMTYLSAFGPRSGSQMYTRTFRVSNTNLYIEPINRASGNYDHTYVIQPPVLAVDGDTLDAELDQFRSYIEYHATIAAMAREEGDPSSFMTMLYGSPDANIPGMRKQVKQWASTKRIGTDPDQIENVRKYTSWGWSPP